jgi:hypothetical protein
LPLNQFLFFEHSVFVKLGSTTEKTNLFLVFSISEEERMYSFRLSVEIRQSNMAGRFEYCDEETGIKKDRIILEKLFKPE